MWTTSTKVPPTLKPHPLNINLKPTVNFAFHKSKASIPSMGIHVFVVFMFCVLIHVRVVEAPMYSINVTCMHIYCDLRGQIKGTARLYLYFLYCRKRVLWPISNVQ